MAKYKIRWDQVLNISELEFDPAQPTVFTTSDELMQSLSWLTAATRHDRRFVRCDETGALALCRAWERLNEVDTDQLYPDVGVTDDYTISVTNLGVLIASSSELIRVIFDRVAGTNSDEVYVPPGEYYWYPFPTQKVTASTVPTGGGSASYVGLVVFN